MLLQCIRGQQHSEKPLANCNKWPALRKIDTPIRE